MPKIVDPTQRRHHIAEAVNRVVMRDGLEYASLRNIAADAGLSIGSVRHYFDNHTEVMAFAMQEISERITARLLQRIDAILDPQCSDRLAAIEALLAEFLPIDEQRRLEVTVWLEFTIAARTRPALQEQARTIHLGMRNVNRQLLTNMRKSGWLLETCDIEVETERLAALLDGLSIGVAMQASQLDPAKAVAVLRTHLDALINRGYPPEAIATTAR